MIQGLSHITLVVQDLERTERLFCQGLGAELIYDSGAKQFSISHEKFFMVGGVWLVAMKGDPCERSYRHIAFQVKADDLPEIKGRLTDLAVDLVPSRPRVDGEGQSLYFYDYDNNFFELHTGSLKARLKRYAL